MVALPDVSALFAVERRPKEVSPVSSVIVISTSLQFTYLQLTYKYTSSSINLGLLRQIIQRQMIEEPLTRSLHKK